MKPLTIAELRKRIAFFDKKIYLARISLNRADAIWVRTGNEAKRELRDSMEGRLLYFCAVLEKLTEQLNLELKKCRALR